MAVNRKKLPPEMLDGRGKMITTGVIREEHLVKHFSVERMFKKVASIENQLGKAKAQIMRELEKYQNWIVKYNNMEDAKFENLTLANYSNTLQVQMKTNNDIVEFDENLQLAKVKIDSCFARWGEASHQNLKVLVDDYFKVGKKGLVNKNSILGLFKFDMKDTEWDEAMELIKKSIVTRVKRSYIMFRYRDSIEEEWNTKNLNFSSI